MLELSKCSSIQKLTLDKCRNITRIGFKHLKKLPNLSILSINGCNLGNEVIKPIAGIKSLTHLSLNGNEDIDSFGLRFLGKGFRKADVPVNIFVDLGPIGPGQKKDLEQDGVRVIYSRANLGKYGVQ